jgi:hypothetical protein
LPDPISAKTSLIQLGASEAVDQPEAGGCGFLKQEGSRVWIAGIPPIRFGVGQDNSIIQAYTTLLNAIGELANYDDLMGRSGAAFRLQLCQPEWCPSAPIACCGFDCTSRAIAISGHQSRDITGNPKDPQACQRRNDLIVAAIDSGAPVLWIEKEAGLVVGYENQGESFLRHYPIDRGEQPVKFTDFSWGCLLILSERHDVPPRRQTVIESLELALHLNDAPSHKQYASGTNAWRLWIAQLRDDARFQRMDNGKLTQHMLANAWVYDSLLDARSAATRYLQRIAGEFDPRTAAQLQRASRYYQELTSVLMRGQPNRCYPWTVAQLQQWTRDMRHAQADTLRQANEHEQQALTCIRTALSSAP